MRIITYISLALLYILILFFLYSNSIIPIKIDYIQDQGNIQFISCREFNCANVLFNLINQSDSGQCLFYDLDDAKIESLLMKKRQYEVHLFDANGKDKKFDTVSSRGLMHNKYCIFENKTILTGTWNPTKRGTYSNDNAILIINSKKIASSYINNFNMIKQNEIMNNNRIKDTNNNYKKNNNASGNKKTKEEAQKETQKETSIQNNNQQSEQFKYYKYVNLSGTLINLCFSPFESCQNEIIETLNTAKKSISFLTFTFTSIPIKNTLITNNNNNITIKGVIEKTRITKYSAYKDLEEHGIQIIKDKNPFTMHEKIFIIDNKTTIIGSYNPTASANEKNEENTLIISNDPILQQSINDEFTRVWKQSQ